MTLGENQLFLRRFLAHQFISMQLPTFVQKAKDRVEFTISLVMFSLVYVFGIGSTAIVARIFQHTFLTKVFPTKSSWQTPTGSQKMERMY